MRARSVRLSVSIVMVLALAITGCSSAAAAPTIDGAWARAAAAGSNSAAYFTIKGATGQADALVSASSADAGMVELNETTTDAAGMAGMAPIDRIDVAAGATVVLEPGGYHVMLMNLKKELAVGGTLQLELVFQTAGKVTVQAEIRQD
jgi:copper(I)-binding protein